MKLLVLEWLYTEMEHISLTSVALFSKAPETFRARRGHKAIFSSSIFKNGWFYTRLNLPIWRETLFILRIYVNKTDL